MLFAAMHESTIGPKQTSPLAPYMSAIGGEPVMAICGPHACF